MSLVFANGLLLVMVLLEIAFLRWYRKEYIPWREVIFNLNSGHVMLWVLRGVELATYHLIFTQWSLGLFASWPPILVWIFMFIAWDFCFYWLHRFHHKFSLLWAVHVIHHEGEHFGLSLGIRNSWYSSITSIPFFIILAWMGIPTEVFLVVSSTHYFIQFYNHNQVVRNSGWLDYIMITPSHHKVHHGKNPEYVDKNFGGTLVIWDKLFGTFQRETKDNPVELGTHDLFRTDNVFLANNLPFAKLLGKVINQNQAPKPSFKLNDVWIATGGIGLFGLLLFFIGIEPVWSSTEKLGLFSMIFIGTIACGGLSEGKNWGFWLWITHFLFIVPLMIWFYGWVSWPLFALTILMWIHAGFLLISYRKMVFQRQ